jgi:hypothetical protein
MFVFHRDVQLRRYRFAAIRYCAVRIIAPCQPESDGLSNLGLSGLIRLTWISEPPVPLLTGASELTRPPPFCLMSERSKRDEHFARAPARHRAPVSVGS